ncbi:MAG TPA: hypothetical protein GXX51_02365 [Firmicutes bacterium]|nr:hypothetical protein [Bacillota bacterium]
MIIDSLARLGRLIIHSTASFRETIMQLSALGDSTAGTFLQRVYIVEIHHQEGGGDGQGGDGDAVKRQIACSPPVMWGSQVTHQGKKSGKIRFQPDFARAIGTPFFLPQGGNPTVPQGYYPVPAYIVYDKDLRVFGGRPEEVKKFLRGRLARTEDIDLTDDEIMASAEQIAGAVARTELPEKEKCQALIVICMIDGRDGSPYSLKRLGARVDDRFEFIVTESLLYPGNVICADLKKIVDRLWAAKLAEGAEMGVIEDGICSICGNQDRLVSIYNKAWPLFLPTWNCPLPQAFSHAGINLAQKTGGLCEGCYKAFTFGASAFRILEKEIPGWLTKELFAPIDSPEGREIKRRAPVSDTVTGCAYLAPLEAAEADLPGDIASDLGEDILIMLSQGMSTSGRKTRDIQSVVGFESCIPEDVREALRLYIMYYSGDRSRGDVHLRATMEDILPSRILKLDDLARDTAKLAAELLQELPGSMDEQSFAYVRNRYGSIPWLLVNAYGPSHLWSSLEKCMIGGRLSEAGFLAGCGHRMSVLGRRWPNSRMHIVDEVLFFHSFGGFLARYNSSLSGSENGGAYQLSGWKVLRKMAEETPPEDLELDDVEKVGFMAGHVIGQFSRMYYAKYGRKDKDFIKDRVMTFGSNLTPDDIWGKGLARLQEYARNLDIHIPEELARKNAMVTLAYQSLRNEIKAQRDLFIASFWSGYVLSGKKPGKSESEEAMTVSQL